MKDNLSEKEQKIFNYLSIIRSAESLFTLESEDLSIMKKIVIEVLNFLTEDTRSEGYSIATSIQIYQILIEADQKLKFSQLFESNSLSIVVQYNLASCHQKSNEIKEALVHITDSIIDYELFSKSFGKNALSENFLKLKKRFVCVYLQTAALYSHVKNHQKALKIIKTGIEQLLICLKDSRKLIEKYNLLHLLPIIEGLLEETENSIKPSSPDQTFKKKTSSQKFNSFLNLSENQKKLTSFSLVDKSNANFKLSSQWLEYFSIQNVMSASSLSIELFKPEVLPAETMNDTIIELILYISICFFAIATEKRYLGISECGYKDHRIEDGYGKKFLNALQNEKSLLLNQNYIERSVKN